MAASSKSCFSTINTFFFHVLGTIRLTPNGTEIAAAAEFGNVSMLFE
jgi:hypothetical protein